MAFDFQTMKARVLQDVWLNTDFFAEEVTYTKMLCGTESTITVHIDVSTGVESGLESERDETGREKRIERLMVLMANDSTTASGGEDLPAVGDTIKRAAAVDPEQIPFVYVGEHEYKSNIATRYTFERTKTTTVAVPR